MTTRQTLRLAQHFGIGPFRQKSVSGVSAIIPEDPVSKPKRERGFLPDAPLTQFFEPVAKKVFSISEKPARKFLAEYLAQFPELSGKFAKSNIVKNEKPEQVVHGYAFRREGMQYVVELKDPFTGQDQISFRISRYSVLHPEMFGDHSRSMGRDEADFAINIIAASFDVDQRIDEELLSKLREARPADNRNYDRRYNGLKNRYSKNDLEDNYKLFDTSGLSTRFHHLLGNEINRPTLKISSEVLAAFQKEIDRKKLPLAKTNPQFMYISTSNPNP